MVQYDVFPADVGKEFVNGGWGRFSFLLMMAKLKICVKYVMKFSVSKTFLHNASENAGIAKQIYQKYIPYTRVCRFVRQE